MSFFLLFEGCPEFLPVFNTNNAILGFFSLLCRDCLEFRTCLHGQKCNPMVSFMAVGTA